MNNLLPFLDDIDFSFGISIDFLSVCEVASGALYAAVLIILSAFYYY